MSPEISDNEPYSVVVAILTMDDTNKGFRGNRRNFSEIIEAGKQARILVYVTTTTHLKLYAKKIIGFTYNTETRMWDRRFYKLPDVVYNRIPFREDEWVPEVQHKINECMNHPHIRLFNSSFFNKWTLFKWLSKNKRTRRFVPITRKYNNEIYLIPLLRKFSFLYLKPEKGKAGMGIMRIRRLPTRKLRYSIDVQEKPGNHVYRYATISQLKEKIREFSEHEDYIVQQGIQLAHLSNRPFDLRVLVQKNNKGKWSISGIGARLAGEMSITTHVPRGGTIEDPRRLLIASFNSTKAKRIMGGVRRSALIIARQIERGSETELGELSLDLGVDKFAKLWFFEANSKPMRFDEPHIRKKSLERLMHYCNYLVKKRAGGRTKT
ncbi:MAG: YheC/YheD family protein [Paenibacillaceae bacterium]